MERLRDLRVDKEGNKKKMSLSAELCALLFGGKCEATALYGSGFTKWGVNRL